jgi:AraC family transcriptional regulator
MMRAADTLAFGEFFGSFERRFDALHCSFGLLAPGDFWRRGRPHTHESTHFMFVLEGDYVGVADGGERTHPRRSVIYVPAGTTHSNHPATANTRILAVSIAPEQVRYAADHAPLPQAEIGFRHGEIVRLATRLERECADWSPGSPLIAAGLCLEMLGAVAARDTFAEGRPPRWLAQAKALIRDHCAGRLTVQGIASTVGVHPIHLSRVFRRFLGCTAGEYLRSCRIERALALLRSPGRSLADIALECGFADQSHFSRTFRRHVGRSPSSFRRGTAMLRSDQRR